MVRTTLIIGSQSTLLNEMEIAQNYEQSIRETLTNNVRSLLLNPPVHVLPNSVEFFHVQDPRVAAWRSIYRTRSTSNRCDNARRTKRSPDLSLLSNEAILN